jgi:hypothetical protein
LSPSLKPGPRSSCKSKGWSEALSVATSRAGS